MLFLTLSVITIQGCVSNPKKEIVLPPKPQREELPVPKTMKDLADIINYYEHLVQEWEQWAKSVEDIIGQDSIVAD